MDGEGTIYRSSFVRYNIFRWYRSGWGKYTQNDPLFFTLQDLNPFLYVRGNPLSGIDPKGTQTYVCTRPLGKPPGPGTPPPIVNHEYACVRERDGSYTCDSSSKQDDAGTFRRNLKPGIGNNPRDVYDKDSCELRRPKNTCLEDCLKRKWKEPRQTYAVGWRGEDCQEYTERVIKECRDLCDPWSLSEWFGSD